MTIKAPFRIKKCRDCRYPRWQVRLYDGLLQSVTECHAIQFSGLLHREALALIRVIREAENYACIVNEPIAVEFNRDYTSKYGKSNKLIIVNPNR